MHFCTMYTFIIRLVCLSTLAFITSNSFAQHSCKSGRADAAALDPRSDTIDILHTSILLDLSQLPSPILEAACTIDFQALLSDVDQITLDLLALTVDSVRQNGNLLVFEHVGEKVNIQLENTLTEGQPEQITVYYHGTPVEDASGFGGFSFSGGYAYNIGVGFLADPHNYGRVWFPCFDNFVERCTFDVTVLCPENLSAYCGGIMTSDVVTNGVRSRRWELSQEIPSYLASVAVAPFVELNYTYESMLNNELNVKLAAVPSDTQAVINAFVSLEPIFHEFEAHFGPYRWDRVGYVMVPFGAGAMEHASNISYPRGLLSSGAAGNQHIMAHELSHHWFGDLVTCRTASEMWLNEGWASYCERLFDEWLINRATYDLNVRTNHKEMLQLCHVRDQGYWPLSNVPHEYTYTNSTYERPSDIIHTLRTYMGDSLFYSGITDYMNAFSFNDASSVDFRDHLELATGLDLHPFFADWVDTPGWGQFIVDSLEYLSAQTYRIHYSQKSIGNDHVYSHVPFELSFRGDNFEFFAEQVMLSGPSGVVDVDVPFTPVFANLNRNEAISEAMTADERVIQVTGAQTWANSMLELNISSIADSVLLRAEHHWVAPDPMKEPFSVYRLSPNRFWRIDGIVNPEFNTSCKFVYNGRTSGTTSGWLDNELIENENDVVLLYRENPSRDWREIEATKQTFSSLTDKFGNFTVDSLLLGEYTFAVIDSSLSIQEPGLSVHEDQVKIFPNPANKHVQVTWSSMDVRSIDIIDLHGRSLGRTPINAHSSNVTIPVTQLKSGFYILSLNLKDGSTISKKIQVQQ